MQIDEADIITEIMLNLLYFFKVNYLQTLVPLSFLKITQFTS